MEFEFAHILKTGSIVKVFALVERDTIQLAFQTPLSDEPARILSRLVIEIDAEIIHNKAWEIYRERQAELIQERKDQGIAGEREAV